MRNESIEQLLGLFQGKVNRLTHFLGLAISLMALNVFAYTLASSLFITHAGAEGLPLSYIAIGLVSVPLYTGFSQVADRYSHSYLFQYLLLGGILLAVILRQAIAFDTLPVYYAIYIGFYFQWRLHLDILFPSLVTDYFTSREYNQNVSYLTMAQGVGGLLGGGLVSLLATGLSTRNMLLVLPLMYTIVAVQLFYLERSEEPLEGSHLKSKSSSSLVENLRVLPLLRKRYPIIDFLILSILLWVILYSLAEFQYFKIYADTLPQEQELTRFMGLFRAINDIVQLLLLYLITRPGLKYWGVMRMNLLYPISTLIGFVALVFGANFPIAVYLNFNNAAWETAINQPAYTLNYNAIPANFIGRVRSLVDGLFYSLGLAITGVLLWVAQSFLETSQTIWIGVIASIIFVAVRYFASKSYLTSLLGMLRAGSVSLKDVGEGLTRLPDNYAPQISQLLCNDNRPAQILGLELAARIKRPSQFMTEIEQLPFEEEATVRSAAVKLFCQVRDPRVRHYLRHQLQSQRGTMQLIALESLIANRQPLSNEELRPLLRATHPEVRVLACVAAENAGSSDPQIQRTCQELWQSPMDDSTQWVVVRAISSTGNRKLIPLLQNILTQATAEVTKEGLNGLAALKPVGNEALAKLAISELDHPDPAVRVAAIDLLGAIRSLIFMKDIARGLEDLDINVRIHSGTAMANYGEASLPLLQTELHSSRPDVVEAAIAAIAKVGTRRAEKILLNYLQPDYNQVSNLLRWRQQLPPYKSEWWALEIVLKDYRQRLIDRVLYVLSCLGHQRTLNYVRQMLDATDVRRRANAIEALASLKHRRFVLPILPLLELPEGSWRNTRPTKGVRRRLLQDVLQASDRWIRLGGILVFAARGRLGPLQKQVTKESDSFVRGIVEQVLNLPKDSSLETLSVSRVLFFKTTPLLGRLSLDELLPLTRAFKTEMFSVGETIGEEGEIGTTLYVIYQGKVGMTQKVGTSKNNLGRLERGDSFGDTGLFDDAPYLATITALSDCVLLTLSRDSFYILIDLYPKLLSCFSQVEL